MKSIKIDEWTSFFCYSFLLNYHFKNYYYLERQKINEPIEVLLRNKNGDKKKGLIEYANESDSFTGKLTER